MVNGKCSECGYTVEPPVYQPAPKPKKITLSPAGTVYVNLGDTLNLDVISDPENAEFSLTWKTSNGRVATVENGQVRGVSEGSVRITATTNNGKSASVTVKVVDPYKPTKVTLDRTGTAQLNLGETLKLTPSLTPATAQADYTWKSSSAKIATVSGGVVTPVGEGTATITVTAIRGKVKKTATVKVKVVDPHKPTKVTLDKTGTVQLNLGETLTLTPSLTPATAQADYTWKTSSAKIATVSGGVVTPVGEGTATITVTAVRGKVKKTAKVKIKVVDPYKPTKVTLDKTGTVQLNLGETLTLTPSLTPATAQADYTWKTSSAKIATVSGGVVTATSEGTATITVTAIRGKVKKTAKVKVKVVDPYKPTKVTLDRTGTVQLNLGETLKLTPSLTPATAQADYTWKTSSAKVATVSGGVVTATSEGTATITVTAVRGKVKKTAKVKIKVVDPMKPTSVILNETGTCWLPLGNTLQLYPRTAPVDLDSTKGEVTYSWKSSSAKVATVDQNGVVYPVGKGTATITVTATRGKVKKTASVKVKVVAPDVADTLIFMQNGTALTSLKLGLGQMAFIGVSVRPYTASNVQISYTSSKPQTASVETSPSGEVVVMGLNPGTTTITATDTISGKKTTLKVTVTK
ncbi:MAG: Ig-like domain-containing protein [Eubacteriales bacterium]|nr:Ig-like domain-containing protein [Eubacteriales bacterium]